MNNPRYVIGIDPDCDKNGYAVVNVDCKEVVCAGTCEFPVLFDILDIWRSAGELIVYVEGGWLKQGNWHLLGRMSAAKAAAIGRSVGMNHQTGILIEQMAKRQGYKVFVVKPFNKFWKGSGHKITADEIKEITGYEKRTNQDTRDAILLAWVCAGLPVKISFRNVKK